MESPRTLGDDVVLRCEPDEVELPLLVHAAEDNLGSKGPFEVTVDINE